MGQKSSKRQSYTPGTSQDAGLPTATTVAENGGIKVGDSGGGANGQVLLLSSKETDSCDVITADVMSPSSSSAAASSPFAVTEKKKRRTPRFVFSRKRTGSGKRSKKNRKEANGVRPTSYPPATLSEETAGPQGTDRDRKAQSMFVEEISEEVVEGVIPWPSDGGQPAPQAAAAEGALKPSPPKKTSSDSTASTSRTHKDKKRNGSQKQKSPSKKKDKDSKKKSKKKHEAADRGKKGADDKTPAEATAGAVVGEGVVPDVEKTQEQAFSLQAASLDTGKDNEDTEVTPGPEDVPAAESTVAEEPVKETVELTVAAVTESNIQLFFPERATGDVEVEDVEEPAMTAEQLLAEIEQTILSKEEHRELRGEEEEETAGHVQAEHTGETQPEHTGETQPEHTEETQPEHTEETQPEHTEETQPEHTEETQPEHTGETQPEHTEETQPEHTEETQPEHTGETQPEHTEETQPEHTEETQPEHTGETQPEHTGETQPEHTGEAEGEEHETTQAASEEEVELAGHIVHEDILELIDIPSPATEPTLQDRSDPREDPGEEEATETKTEMTFSVSDVTKDVMESGMIVEVLSSVGAVRQETSADTVQQQVENLMDSTEASLKTSEVHEELEASQTAATTEPSDEVSQSVAQSLEQDAARPEASAAAEEEPTAENANESAEGAPSSAMTPAQLKALDKERKAAKKREDKERAKREKEEKKRLKEEKKREAREKKKREKEEKEQKLREAKEGKEKARASAHMAIEVRPEEAAQEAATTSATTPAPTPAAGKAAEVVSVSQAVTVESTPSLSVSADMFSQLEEDKQFVVQTKPDEDKTDFVQQQQPLPSTSTDSDDVHLNVDGAVANLPAPFTAASIPPSTSSTSEADMDGQLLGSSVKEIITTIENNVTLEPRTCDEDHPPEIPDTPYPDEEDAVQPSSAVAQFSAAPDSPASSEPTSPESPEPPQAGSPAEPGPPSKSLVSPEVIETARSSVLRRIELGPRLRTAILRKSSSGVESEEKRVSLTKPRHVQVSDLTPPPRKPRSSRPLEHTRDSSGNYRYSSHGSLTSPEKDPEPVVEEELTVQVSSSKNSSSSGQEAEGKEDTEGESGRTEGKEELTMVTSSVTESAQLPSSPSTTQNTEEKAADSSKDDGLQTNDRLMMEGFFSSGSESTQTAADCPALHAVTNIVLAGQAEPQHSAELTDPQAPVSAENQSRSNDDLLQKVAAEVVQTIQKAAQEKASALDLPEEVVREVSKDASQIKLTSEVSSMKCQDGDEAESVRTNVEDCAHHSDEDESDSDAGLVQATVVCSAELVSSSSERATRPAVPLPTDCPTKDRQEPPPQPSGGAAVDSDNSGKQPETESSELRGTDPQICQGAGDQTQATAGGTINVVETTSPASEPSELVVETTSPASEPSELVVETTSPASEPSELVVETTSPASEPSELVVETTSPASEPSELVVETTSPASEPSELVVETTSPASEPSELVVETTSPASEPSELGMVLVTQQTQSASSSAPATESSFDLKVEGHDLAEESNENPEEEGEDSADTLQLQQCNKNYNDISVVLDDDEEDEDVTKTQSKSADSTSANNNLPEESSGDPHSSSEPSSSEKTSSPSSSQQPTGSSEPEQPLQAPQVSCNQLENGEGHVEEVQTSEQQERVKVTVRCNGSHVHNPDSAEDSIDSLLKLQGGLGEEKQVVLDTLEHNNNVSSDQKTVPERAESPAASGTTNDSRD